MKKSHLLLLTGTTLAVGPALLLSSSSALPKGAVPVTNLDPEKYLGKWYEIARFDFFFEKNVDNTTAHYSLNDDGSIKVVNRGYNYKKEKWQEADAKAKFISTPNVGRLKVSFFGPFYSPYNIIEIDGDYQYALVVGKNTDYIWFLSRTPEMPESIKQKYLQTAESLGYDLTRLVWVEHGNR
ncbi:MAG: lipocalin family protein [Bacteroidia bacterium]|nr:lipocalin family protein [Bacteroidia bacterium]